MTVELLSLSVCFRFAFEELCNGYLGMGACAAAAVYFNQAGATSPDN